MKNLKLALALSGLIMSAPVAADENWRTVDGTAIACQDYFSALEVDKLMDAKATSILQHKLNDDSFSCAIARKGLEYRVVESYYHLDLFFHEAYGKTKNGLIKFYIFDMKPL